MSEESLPLEAIMPALQGVIPSPFATSSADGVPNITYLSIVQYVDAERVALSRQFFRKTSANLDENRFGQVVVVDPATIQEYALDLRYLHTETEGLVFDTMKANLDAIASHTGVGDVFRLRGVDVHHVERCVRIGPDGTVVPAAESARDVLRGLDDFVRRVAGAGDLYDATRAAMQALEDVFGFTHAILLTAAGPREPLVAVAGNGYAASPAGAEVALGDGMIGVAAQRGQVVSVANLTRGRVMGTAVHESARRLGDAAGTARQIPLPGLADVASAAAVPLILHGDVLGVLYLESRRHGCFGGQDERLLRIVGGHLAAVLAAFGRDRDESASQLEVPAAGAAAPAAAPLEITYYQADDSVFAGDDYVIKGVPGRILWKLLREHAVEERTVFTNRQLRLDERLGLPAGNDNLESRLVVLRRRLEAGGWGIELDRVGRGRLELRVRRSLALVEVPTQGPMRAAHDGA